MIIRICLILLTAICIGSCTPSAPYTIKSPCVSGGTDAMHEYAIYPCIRKPINYKYTVA